MFWTGTETCFVNTPMGKNTISKVPKGMATILKKSNPADYTFHTMRRTSATAAAESGATVAQMMDYYGWKNPSMPQEYVSSSKKDLQSMAIKLQGTSDQPLQQQPLQFVPKAQPDQDHQSASKVVYINNFSGTLNL